MTDLKLGRRAGRPLIDNQGSERMNLSQETRGRAAEGSLVRSL